MPRWVSINNVTRAKEQVVKARWCQSYLCKLRGLTFRRILPRDEGLILVEKAESRTNASIHMWMVFFPIAVAWLNKDLKVVDLKIAKPWRVYFPDTPAQYVLEGPVEMIERIAIDDQLEWVDA
jgi:uncharacterized membrane protein (UPF0127 family)